MDMMIFTVCSRELLLTLKTNRFSTSFVNFQNMIFISVGLMAPMSLIKGGSGSPSILRQLCEDKNRVNTFSTDKCLKSFDENIVYSCYNY